MLNRFQTVALVLNLALLVELCGASPRVARAQPPSDVSASRIYTHNKSFCLPIALDVRQRAMLQEVQLYVKNGPSEPWICKETAPPTRSEFNYSVSQDGEYWFAIAMVKKNTRLTPVEISRMAPGLVVIVDTRPPDISVRMLPLSGRGALIECKVQDANPDPAHVTVECQGADKLWQALSPLPEDPTLFHLPTPAMQETLVRATATDRAGNTATRVVPLAAPQAVAGEPASPRPGLATDTRREPWESNVTPAATPAASPAASNMPTPPASAPVAYAQGSVVSGPPSTQAVTNGTMISPVAGATTSPGEPWSARRAASTNDGNTPSSTAVPVASLSEKSPPLLGEGPGVRAPADRGSVASGRQLINDTHVSLEYQIEKQGPSGIGKVEVWMTRDEGMTWQRLCEDTNRRSPVEFDLPGDGVYGVSLVTTNGMGFGGTPPVRGDVPDYWVEVDTTKPVVQLSSIRPGIGADAGTLLISWHASDKNLGDTPIDLYYANRQEGPWVPIAHGAKNDGTFRWMLPRESGQEFYIRLEVTDRAGNLARCDAPQPVFVDMTRPKARVVGIKAGASRSAASGGN